MKKFIYTLVCSVAAIAAVSVFSLFTGCEDSDGLDALTVYPSSATLDGGTRSQVFTVHDSTNSVSRLSLPVEWTVADPSLGRITEQGASSCVYIRYARGGQNTVIATDQYGNEGYASVIQQ